MSAKKIQFLVASTLVSFVCVAGAQNPFTGVLQVNDQTPETGFFTSSSLSMDISNVTSPFPGAATGTFALTVPAGSEVMADSTILGGLSSTPISESVPDFLVFASQGPFTGGIGTSPANRFSFDLLSLSEIYNPSTGLANFVGTGTLADADVQGTYSTTPADLYIGFSGPNTYSFTVQAIPEPSTFGILAGLGLLPFIRRKT